MSVASNITAWAWNWLSLRDEANFSALSILWSAIMTFAPSFTKRSAVALPMPFDAPVIRATLFTNFFIMTCLFAKNDSFHL